MGGVLGRNPKMPKFGNYEVFSDFRSQHINLSNRTYLFFFLKKGGKIPLSF